MHVKGDIYEELRGTKGQLVVGQYIKAEKMTSGFAKQSLAAATDDEFHSANSSKVVTRDTVYNLGREVKEKKQKTLGLTSCKLTSVFRARFKCEGEDSDTRSNIGDSSRNLLGIVRKVELCPSFQIQMWTKAAVQLFQHLGRGKQLVINVDATGGLLDFPAVQELKHKIQHTKITVSPKYALVDRAQMQDKRVARMLSPLTIGGMVSNKNTAAEVHKFYSAFIKSVQETFPNEQYVNPLLCLTDCAAQLESAALTAFSAEGMTTSRIGYGNRVLVHLLHYDKLMADIDEGRSTVTRQEASIKNFNHLRKNISIFLKECKSRVYRAPTSWMHRNKSSEFTNSKVRFESALKATFVSLLEQNRISDAIVQGAIVIIAMLETERFVTSSFDDGMQT